MKTNLSKSHIKNVTSPKKISSFVKGKAQWKGRSVYAIFNPTSKEIYIGKTCNPSQRLTSHRSKMRGKSQLKIYKALRKNPTQFSFGCLFQGNNYANTEKNIIAFLKNNTDWTLLNSDQGGGGGAAYPEFKKTEGGTLSPITKKRKFYTTTPEKRYLLDQTISPGRTKKFKITYTPGIRKKSKEAIKNLDHVIYLFKKEGEGKDKAYIGRTCDPIQRSQQWTSDITLNKNHPLVKEVRNNENSTFSFSILHKVSYGENPTEHEAAAISEYKERGYTLLNGNEGGGGGFNMNYTNKINQAAPSFFKKLSF